MNAQPLHGPTHPACNTPNPPWWCNPVPLDDCIWLLFSVGVLVIGYINYKRKHETI